MPIERRGFLGRASLGMLAFAGLPVLDKSPASARSPEPSEPWLRGLTGRHKQYFDVAAHGQGAPLKRAANFLDQYDEAYKLKDTDINVVFGVHGSGLALALGDNLWSKYRLGSFYSIDDPLTKAPAVRNIFAGSGSGPSWFDPSIAGLQKRGVRFVACRQAIARLSRDLAARELQPAAPINDAILAGLLTGVTPVPAAIVAVNRAQEAGLTYVYLG